MIGYFDPDSLKLGETDGVITFISASNGSETHEVRIENRKDTKRIVAALKDQMDHGMAGLNGRFKKVQGTFASIPQNPKEGIITDPKSRKETPVRIGFDVKPEALPKRGLCVAIGEMVDGALMVERMTIAPIAPMPAPQQGMQTPAG